MWQIIGFVWCWAWLRFVLFSFDSRAKRPGRLPLCRLVLVRFTGSHDAIKNCSKHSAGSAAFVAGRGTLLFLLS